MAEWLIHLWTWFMQPLPPLLDFPLRAIPCVAAFAFLANAVSGLIPDPKKHEYPKSAIKTFRSKNDEMVVCLTADTLRKVNYANGQKVMLRINGTDPTPVTIQKRHKSSNLDHDNILLSHSILQASAISEDKIHRATLFAVNSPWKKLMLQSFDHPDSNHRLTWWMAIWSLIASTVAGVLVSHFHMLMPK